MSELTDSLKLAAQASLPIVCSPRLYPSVLDYVRKHEAQDHSRSMFRLRCEIEWNARQIEPEVLVFDDRQAFVAHWDALNQRTTAA